jgi:hypothetical protein
MLDIQLPPPYIPALAPISEQVSSENFKFGKFIFFGNKENIILNAFELLGGTICDRKNTEIFLKDNPFVIDNFNEVAKRLSKSFNGYNFHDLKLEYIQREGESPELFLIVKTKYVPEEATVSLRDFDKWFVPNIFKEFTSFNVNLEFI